MAHICGNPAPRTPARVRSRWASSTQGYSYTTSEDSKLAKADRERRALLPAWPSWYRAFPRVMVVLANRERANLGRRLETLLALCRAEPELQECPDLSISFVLLDDLLAWGPFAPIFRRPEDDRLVNWLGQEADAPHQRRSA